MAAADDDRSAPPALGSGFRLEPAAGGLRLTTPFAPPGWRARRPGAAQRAAFPGTGLEIDGRWWEIVAGGGDERGASYELAPWDDAAVFRQALALTPTTCRRLADEHRRAARRARRSSWLTALSFLTGALPADDQRRLERDYGVLASSATARSAIVFLIVGAFLVMAAIAIRYGHSFGVFHPPLAALAPYWPLWAYLALEATARLRSAWQMEEPLGSLPVALPVLALRSLRRGLEPRAADERAVARSWGADEESFAAARDRVRPLPASSGRLEVVSRLPKDHWTLGVTGIRHEGAMYFLAEREILDGPEGPRHRFVLEPASPDVVFRTGCEYRPEEVREVYREARRLRAATWVGTLSFFWGLLGEELQRALEEGYGYRPRRFTRFALAGTTVLGAYNLVASAARGVGGDAGPADLAVFASGVFLLWETALRYRDYRAGRLRPSLLGLPFAPLARRALRWLPGDGVTGEGEGESSRAALANRPGRRR